MDYHRSSALRSLMPDEETPVRTMAEIIKNISPPVGNRKIRSGETLSSIASEAGVSIRELMRLNPQIKNPNLIKSGEELSVPSNAAGRTIATDYTDINETIQTALRPGIEEGAVEGAFPEELLPLMKPLGMLGALGATKGIGALAGAAPRAARAGMLGNTVKGAVNWPGAKPSLSNVAPVGNPGMVKAMLAKMRGPQPPMAETIMPNPTRALNRQGAALNQLGPQMYPGNITPQVANNSLLQALRQGERKMMGNPNEALLQTLMQKARSAPDLADIHRAGARPTMSDLSFEDLATMSGHRW